MLTISQCYSQSIRLTPFSKTGALYWDMDKFFHYNNYEKARINLSASYVYPSNASKIAEERRTQWQANAYCGFATGNKRWNFGATAGAKIKGTATTLTPYLSIRHDLSMAASTYVNIKSSNDIWEGTRLSFATILSAANRYIEIDEQTAAIKLSLNNQYHTELKLGHSRERYCFDKEGHIILYPWENTTENALQDIAECTLTLNYNNKIASQLTVGGRYNVSEPSALRTKRYLRLIAQANKTLLNEKKYSVFMQAKAGITTQDVPYSRLWDVSGTHGNLYFFEESMTTIKPNTFQCNGFAKGLIRIERNTPLWNTRYSRATPFCQVSLLYGWLWRDAEQWEAASYGIIDEIHVAAPTHGVAEPAIGIKKLIHIGMLDMGAAVAYQITPTQSAYHNSDPQQNIAVTICLTLQN